MKNIKIVLSGMALLLTVSLVAGCGSDNKTTAQPDKQTVSKTETSHEQHNMPAEDPKPILADMEKQLADVIAKQKSGQTSETQKIAAQLVQTVEKLEPHIMDAELKKKTKQSVLAIKEAVHAAKVDQAAVDAKINEFQDLLPKIKSDLNNPNHNHN